MTPPLINMQPNPEEWYRGGRDQYPSVYTDSQRTSPRGVWLCKWKYISLARLEQQEVYNQIGRRWHWRLGTDMLTFSFFNDSWTGPANTAQNDATHPANYQQIIKQTLLVASDDDDWNTGYLPPNVLQDAGAIGGAMTPLLAAAGFDGPIVPLLLLTDVAVAVSHPYFRWEDRWTQTRQMASLMTNTPGYTLWVPNTGHSIHNERPRFFATQIVNFLASNSPAPVPLQPWPNSPSALPNDESCDNNPLTSELPTPIAYLLDGPPAFAQASAALLMQPSQPGGAFSDNTSPGTHGLRLRPILRMAAQDMRTPAKTALVSATLAFYNNDLVLATAFADLAVTGLYAYLDFYRTPPSDADIAAAATAAIPIQQVPGSQFPQYQACVDAQATCPSPGASNAPLSKGNTFRPPPSCAVDCRKKYPQAFISVPPDSQRVIAGVQFAKNRAYQVAWAVRRPDLPASYLLRKSLGWIAVSAEDDPPDRPVNVPSGIPVIALDNSFQGKSYPQYTLIVPTCPMTADATGAPTYVCGPGQGTVFVDTRYTIASLPPTPTTTTLNISAVAPVNRAPPIVQHSVVTASILSASACLTGDGVNCLASTSTPVAGQVRKAIVTVLSNGLAVGGAAVSIQGQAGTTLTNPNGVAVVNYVGCTSTSYRAAGPTMIPYAVPAPCALTAAKAGYGSATINVP
jgi:hypothetical protein